VPTIPLLIGEKFGLIDPNEAGKTIMISISSTLIQHSSGYAIISGESQAELLFKG